MPLPTTTEKDLIAHLEALGVGPGDRLCVHSRLISFGRIDGGPDAVWRALAGVVTGSGTVVVPTYTTDLGPLELFDRSRTPSQQVGVLSEHVRRLPDARRSRCPMHSHAAVGAEAGVLDHVSGEVSLGAGSDFEALHDAGFSLLLLGCSFDEGATYVHHMEAAHGVPYREWLELPRLVQDPDDTPRTMTVRYYGRSDRSWNNDFEAVRRRLDDVGCLRTVPCHFGESHLVTLGDLHTACTEILERAPHALVTQRVSASRERHG